MAVRIFRPAKTAMQSGEAGTRQWVLEHERAQARDIDPLTGWTSSRETSAQVRLHFDTREEAIAYAERNGLAYSVSEPHERTPVRKSYSDNFRHDRKFSWTH